MRSCQGSTSGSSSSKTRATRWAVRTPSHGQVWALDSLTTVAEKEDFHQREYLAARKSLLLLDCLDREIKSGERMVVENDHWAVLVPFWAVWPYEVILIPKRHVPSISELDAGEKPALARIPEEPYRPL